MKLLTNFCASKFRSNESSREQAILIQSATKLPLNAVCVWISVFGIFFLSGKTHDLPFYFYWESKDRQTSTTLILALTLFSVNSVWNEMY